MAIEFTEEQQEVIDIRDKNVLVSAAAGSGKTAVLVERIFSLIRNEENNIDIDRLLVVTFTKAAAAEMRERVHKRIAEELDKNPDDAHLQKQYALVHRAMITTIDAFCQNVLRNHFHEIGLDPDFRVMDEGEKQLMRRDVLAQLLEEKYAEGDEAFLDAAMFFAPKSANDSEFEECILELQNYSESFAWPDRFLEERKEDNKDTFTKLTGVKAVNGTVTGDPLGVYLFKYLLGTVEGCIELYDSAIDICLEPSGPYGYKDTYANERDALKAAVTAQDIQDFGQALKDYKNNLTKAPNIKKGECDDDLKADASKLRTKAKEGVFAVIKAYFTPDLKSACEFSDKTSPYINTLIDITLEFRKRFMEKKAQEHVVDFGDMEHFALNVLIDESGNPTPVAEQYREHFKEIMVDEYQDSNLVQDVLLGAIASKDPAKYDRFMVGDVKQSIYGFRQARPDLFLEKYASYPGTEGCKRLDLSKNFRSRKEVLDSVNEIFERIMQPHTGGIEYDKDARLYLGADYPECDGDEFKAELVLFDHKGLTSRPEAMNSSAETTGENAGSEAESGSESEKDQEADNGVTSEAESESDEYSAEESEAVVLAHEVKELMKGRVTERKKGKDGKEIKFFRPVRYSDIVILHRSPAKLADAIGRIFEKEGIPISISTGGGYFSVPEIQQVMQFLRAISNPLNEIPLYGVLVSLFGGYTPESIAQLRAKYRTTIETKQRKKRVDKPLWEIVKAELPEFAEKLERYRKLSTYRTVRELLQVIFDDHDYPEIVSAMPAGAKRKANVEMLLSYASAYEKTSYFGLYHFVRYIDQLQKYTADKTSEADVLGESADVVRLMTIHKSKGLEFPIVILGGMGKQFNLSDTSSKLVHNNEFGLGYVFVDTKKRTKTGTLRHELVAKRIKEDTLAEEMRLLYVAMTRAKEKLVMVGRVSGAEKVLDKAMSAGRDSLTYAGFMKSKSYLDMVLPVIGKCSSIACRTIGYADLEISEVEDQITLLGKRQDLKTFGDKADPEKLDALKKRLSYEYPFKNLEALYTKTTVSELKIAAMLDTDEAAYEQFESREVEEYIPRFRQGEKKISGAVRGDSYHRVMEIMDFDRTVGRVLGGIPADLSSFAEKVKSCGEEIKAAIADFIAEELREKRISEDCSIAVNPSKITRFLSSSLAYRMWKSGFENGLYREQPFVLSLSAKRVNPDFPEEERVLIQGIIDAYFVEEDGIVLLDYKTDSVEKGDDLVARYKTQLDYYQEAIERLTGKKVKERILYSFHMGETVSC